MNEKVESGIGGFRNRRAKFIAAAGFALLLVSFGVWIAFRPRAAKAMVVEPATANLTDKAHREDEIVRSRFRLANPLSRPITVKEIATSCSCTASLVEGGKTTPLTLDPGEAVDFWLETHPIPQADLIQVVRAVISSECDGQPLPTTVAMMRILVEDPPKPVPASIQVGDAPVGEPVKRQFVLTTASASTKVGRPQVTVSDPSMIRAALVEGGPTGLFEDHLTGHYRIDVEFVANRDVDSIDGHVDVRVDGRAIRIPVVCRFHRPYRLSQKTIRIEGRPGDMVVRDLYYESLEPGWEQPEVLSIPTDVELAVKPFDATTRVLTIRARVPEAGKEPANRDIILRPRGRDDRITIPISYGAAG